MIKTLLPNCRFLALPSAHLGQDWTQVSGEIDSHLEELGMDLAEEAVYLLFDRAPGSVLAGEAQCLIARSVIGPKRSFEGKMKQVDWVQAPVYRKVLLSRDWDQIKAECFEEWQKLQRQGQKIAAPFMIVARRRMGPELTLSLEVLFHE